jgi:hypothetical protein
MQIRSQGRVDKNLKRKKKILKRENQHWIAFEGNELIIEGVDWDLGGFMFVMVYHLHIE